MIETLLAGGVTGLVGAALEKITGIGVRILELKEKEKERAHELKLIDRQAQIRMAETELEGKIAMQKSDSENLIQSYAHDNNVGHGSQWVVNLLRLVRPVITFGFIGLTALIYFTLGETESNIKYNVVDNILYTTSLVTAWWFGSRARAK